MYCFYVQVKITFTFKSLVAELAKMKIRFMRGFGVNIEVGTAEEDFFTDTTWKSLVIMWVCWQTWKKMKSFRGQRFRVSQISANRELNISTFCVICD